MRAPYYVISQSTPPATFLLLTLVNSSSNHYVPLKSNQNIRTLSVRSLHESMIRIRAGYSSNTLIQHTTYQIKDTTLEFLGKTL